ncbi:MAG: four helix bundle protein [Bacteroidales bacterium]|nr:four helix bundle protein [Bacteroidales bacterium]
MSTINRFEDIKAWQKSRELCKEINKITSFKDFSKDFELKNQINASSGSVMDNIAEGFERSGNKEFIYFLSIAKGSAGEVRSQLYRALDKNYIDNQTFDEIFNLAEITIQLIAGLMNYLKKSSIKGTKFKH